MHTKLKGFSLDSLSAFFSLPPHLFTWAAPLATNCETPQSQSNRSYVVEAETQNRPENVAHSV